MEKIDRIQVNVNGRIVTRYIYDGENVSSIKRHLQRIHGVSNVVVDKYVAPSKPKKKKGNRSDNIQDDDSLVAGPVLKKEGKRK